MAEILLRELSNADIDWMVSIGTKTEIPAGTTILAANEVPTAFHVILAGEIAFHQVDATGPIDVTGSVDASGAPSTESGTGTGPSIQPTTEVMCLSSGGVVGETMLFDTVLPVAVVAKTDVRLFSLDKAQLVAKLSSDLTFSGHLYRAIALILSDRLRRFYASPDQFRLANRQSAKEAMVVFGELRDSDVDWLMSVGQIQPYNAPDDFLVQAGRPVEALYIVLSGQFSVLVFQGGKAPDPFSVCFECPYQTADTMKTVMTLSKGQMAGTIAFLDFHPHLFSIRATSDAMVLRIPRPQLAAKLLQDMGFSTRFHRILCLQLLDLLNISMAHLGVDALGMETGDEELGGELDMASLHHASQGAARFNWMLNQLGAVT